MNLCKLWLTEKNGGKNIGYISFKRWVGSGALQEARQGAQLLLLQVRFVSVIFKCSASQLNIFTVQYSKAAIGRFNSDLFWKYYNLPE
jgi:hypothetical protein